MSGVVPASAIEVLRNERREWSSSVMARSSLIGQVVVELANVHDNWAAADDLPFGSTISAAPRSSRRYALFLFATIYWPAAVHDCVAPSPN